MKVYRGYNNEVGPISYVHWIYVTPDIEQAKWYATKDGEVEDGDIIEYDLDVDHLRFLSLNKLNSLAQDENEIYTEEDLLWYQEGLGESLYKYVAGIVFKDPHSKRDHTIYIVFSQDHLKNGRVLSKEEFEKIELRESDNNEYLDEPETPPEIGCEKVYYRGIHKFVIEHIQDDEDMGGEEYFHIYNYEKTDEDSDWYEIDDTAKYSWEDCLYYMNDFGKPQTSFTEPPSTDGSEFLDETVKLVNKEFADTKLITTAYELNAYLKNNTESRVVYDVEKKWFLVGDSETSIHIDLINDALFSGLYKPFEWNGKTYPDDDIADSTGGKILYDMHPKKFVLFRTSSDSLNGEDYYYDRYQYCYIYKDYCVFDRKGDFEGTPLYNYLGEPIDIENNGNVLKDEGIIEQLNEYTIKRRQGIEFVGYHGSKEPNMTPREKSPLYLCDNYKLALAFAKGEIQDDGLYYDEIPTVFTFKGRFNKPYYMQEDQYDDEGQDSNIDYEKWVDDGYDGIVVQGGGTSKYYIVLDTSKIRLVDKKEFPEYARGYGEVNEEELNESIVYGEMKDDEMMVILHNPTRKELKDNGLDDECRIVKDGNDGYYFASSNYTHEQIENKLKLNNLPYIETIGEFYYYQDNLFATRDDWNTKEEYEEYKKSWYNSLKSMPYIVKNFGNFRAEVFGGEYLNESVLRNVDGEIGGYYTRSSRELLSIIDNKYKENDIRVMYDIDRNLYVFSDTYTATHFNLILYMILFTNVYDDIPEIRDNKYENDDVVQDIIKSKLYLATFKIFRNYDNDSDEEFINFLRNIPENATDGYDYGYVCKINDKLWAICRDDEIGEAKQVPLLQNKTWINLKDNVQIDESTHDAITFKPTTDEFYIGGKNFKEEDEDCCIYKIMYDGNKIGYLAISEYSSGVSIDGIEIDEPYRNQGFGTRVVNLLKKKYNRIYVRSVPDAKGFWEKQGHKSNYNKDSGTYDGDIINESVNLKKLNRLAGFYHYNSGDWEMLPRTEKNIDMDKDYEEYCKYCHDYTVEDLFEEDMIRFHIEDIGNVVCTIESPYQHWIKPFIRKLYVKFPEEMAMVKKIEIEYYKEDGTREYRTLEV